MKQLPYKNESSKLWLLLSQTRQAIFKLRQKELSKYNLSNIEAGVLTFIDSLEPKCATPINIARFYLRAPHAVSQLLSRMEKKKLIIKKNDLIHKNLVRVEITEKGREALEIVNKRQIIDEIIGSLTQEQYKALESSLLLLLNNAMNKLNIRDKLFIDKLQYPMSGLNNK